MSTDEHLFFDPGTPSIEDAARVAAHTLGADRLRRGTDSAFVLPWPAGSESTVIGGFEDNDYTAYDPDPSVPEDRSIFDPLPFLISMALIPGDGTYETQMAAARDVFDRLAASGLGWPLVLVHEFELLVATFDVDRGVREFPPGTRSDGTDEHLWR